MDIATIQKRIASIEEYSGEIKIAKQAIKDELEASEPYLEAAAAAKAANQKKKQVKDEVMHQTHLQKLQDDIRVNQEEIATLFEILSAELMDLYKETNSDEITGEDGQVRKFKLLAKLLPINGFERQ